jgi:hypothetical protein
MEIMVVNLELTVVNATSISISMLKEIVKNVTNHVLVLDAPMKAHVRLIVKTALTSVIYVPIRNVDSVEPT